ncbi:MAG: HD domain-containing protein, partial [Bacteroidota bacterium]
PYGILFDLIEHPYFQRLRRIKQVSLTHLVYPGALHTRFHHALGALHLMIQAIDTLRNKGVEVTEEEATAVYIAILLHDIGHGPFSHTLENTLLNVAHERVSLLFMEQLNEEFNGALSLAIQIFKNQYEKKFLHQLVSSQLDMDRMDYLNRDSFFTGVYEGVIGYDRIIKMLAVHDGELVVEQKGIYSVEKFLMARRFMYWQVYLHKTVLSAEQMMIQTVKRAKHLILSGEQVFMPKALDYFIRLEVKGENLSDHREELLAHFSVLDDHDVSFSIKTWMNHPDRVLAYLARSLVNRRLFRLKFQDSPFSKEEVGEQLAKLNAWWQAQDPQELNYLLIQGSETNSAYQTSKDEIKILYKNGRALPLSMNSEYDIQAKQTKKFYLCYPKAI